jgi:hypothetical protein
MIRPSAPDPAPMGFLLPNSDMIANLGHIAVAGGVLGVVVAAIVFVAATVNHRRRATAGVQHIALIAAFLGLFGAAIGVLMVTIA